MQEEVSEQWSSGAVDDSRLAGMSNLTGGGGRKGGM